MILIMLVLSVFLCLSCAQESTPQIETLAHNMQPPKRRIAFIRSDKNKVDQIWLIRSDGLNEAKLTKNGGNEPAWSPDGNSLAFTSHRTGKDEIWIAHNALSNRPEILRATLNGGYSPTWSHNGMDIAFVSDRSGTSRIYIVSAPTLAHKYANQDKLLYVNPNKDEENHPTWMPSPKDAFDKTYYPDIAFVRYIGRGNFDIYGIKFQDLKPKNLSNTRTLEVQPDYSYAVFGGRRKIAFSRNSASPKDPPRLDICIVYADGKNKQQLTDDPHADAQPSWNKGGTHIAFASNRDWRPQDPPWRRDIYIIDVKSKKVKRLTKKGGSDPAWNPRF